MDVETILFDTLYAETPPERQKPCDCWVADQDHRLARKLPMSDCGAETCDGGPTHEDCR